MCFLFFLYSWKENGSTLVLGVNFSVDSIFFTYFHMDHVTCDKGARAYLFIFEIGFFHLPWFVLCVFFFSTGVNHEASIMD